MTVSEETKYNFCEGIANKKLNINFPDLDLTIESSQIVSDSMKLQESIMESDSVEFVGCIASMFGIRLYGIEQNLKSQKISVSTNVGTDEEIPLFTGIVDSAPSESNKNYKKITAYDELYTKGQIDVAPWYNSLTFPTTQKEMRDSLFRYLGIEQVEITLPNDDMVINKEYEPTALKAISVIKSICQINGAFGIMNRENKFEYRILTELFGYEGTYPSETLYPPFYPSAYGISTGGGNTEPTQIAYYRSVEYEEFTVKPVDKVTIRTSEEDTGVSYGNGMNNYIIQGNMFATNKTAEELTVIAERIYNNIKDISFIPFTAVNNGLPWLECGKDTVSYALYDFVESNKQGKDVYTIKQFYIFNRTLEGIQALKDTYSVKGDEYQHAFITDLQLQIDGVKESAKEVAEAAATSAVNQQMGSYTYSKSEIDNLLANLILSVDALPANPDPNKYYAIRES